MSPRSPARRARWRSHPMSSSRLDKARKVLDQAAASGQQIYGLNTGLGANLGTSVEGDASAFQRQLLEGRSGAVGEALPVETVRATMFARAAMLVGRRLRPFAGRVRRPGRRAQCRRPSGDAVAGLDRRRRSGADDGARPHADRRRRSRLSGPAHAGGQGADDGAPRARQPGAQGRAVADQRLGGFRRQRRAGAWPMRCPPSRNSSRPAR